MENLIVTDLAGGELRLSPGATTGIYTSTAVAAGFSFNAIVPHWNGDVPLGAVLLIDLRFRTAQRGWSKWHHVDDAEWSTKDEQFYPEAPLLLSNGRQFQYRVTMAAPFADDANRGAPPVLNEMTLTYMDTSTGPDTFHAKAMAQMGPPVAKGVPQPAIIPREAWGADESYRTWKAEYRTMRTIVIHHTFTTNDYSEEQATQWVRAIYYYHAVTRAWGDIGYNYLVDRYGNIHEGRYGGPGSVGAHVYNHNSGSVGVAMIGTHGNHPDGVPPTDEALTSLAHLSAWIASRSYIHPLESEPFRDVVLPNLGGHRDYPPYSTTCPGDDAYAKLPAVRQSVWGHMVAHIPEYDIDWVAWRGLSATLRANETYSLTMSVRNVGSFAWPHDGNVNRVRLGYHWLDGNGKPVVQPSEDDHRTSLTHDLTFGHTHDFESVLVTTPITPGTYTLAWDMVHEGISWFHDANVDSPLLAMALTIVGASEATPTPSPSPTATLTPSATVVPALEGVENGRFEGDGAWTIQDTTCPARYAGEPRRGGDRALRTGIDKPAANVYSYSWAEQTLILPAAGDITLRYWYQAQVHSGAFAYVLLRKGGRGWQQLQIIRKNVDLWTEAVRNLSPYGGKTVTLRSGTYNNSRGGKSAMYVDDVSVHVGAYLQ